MHRTFLLDRELVPRNQFLLEKDPFLFESDPIPYVKGPDSLQISLKNHSLEPNPSRKGPNSLYKGIAFLFNLRIQKLFPGIN